MKNDIYLREYSNRFSLSLKEGDYVYFECFLPATEEIMVGTGIVSTMFSITGPESNEITRVEVTVSCFQDHKMYIMVFIDNEFPEDNIIPLITEW